jgi:sterol desaturase/sphingolipid hydroxylase (fatty acid hydroxylase superfamily)
MPVDWTYLSPLVIVSGALVIICLERLLPYDEGQPFFRKGFFNDFVLYTLVQSYVLGLLINAFIARLDAKSGLSRLHLVSSWPVWAQVLLFFITHDFYIYWFHRLQHKSPILWRTHEAHHSVEDVDWLAGSRSHALEILVNQTIEYAPIVLLGAAPQVALVKGAIDAVWGMYIHSNVDVHSGRLQYVINGPEMHRWHHSNRWTKLAIWDWMFGTAYLPHGQKPEGYGLTDEDFPENYFVQHVFAFRRFRGGEGLGSFGAVWDRLRARLPSLPARRGR